MGGDLEVLKYQEGGEGEGISAPLSARRSNRHGPCRSGNHGLGNWRCEDAHRLVSYKSETKQHGKYSTAWRERSIKKFNYTARAQLGTLALPFAFSLSILRLSLLYIIFPPPPPTHTARSSSSSPCRRD